MGSIKIVLGRSRWRRRAVLPAEALSGIDGWGRPTFLYIAPTAAKRRAVEREFVAFRPNSLPCFAPSVRVFDEFIDDLWARHGDGRALLSNGAAITIALRILQEIQQECPWLSSLGLDESLAAALVNLHDRVTHSGAPLPTDLPHHVEIELALRQFGQALSQLSTHVSRPDALVHLVARLDPPPPALTQQLRSFRTVIIDDTLQPSPLEQAVLIGLCRALAAAGSHVVIALETGRDLGGDEAGLFFEYDDVHRVAYALRPFQATRGLRQTLFSELIASGEATIAVALRGALIEVEPGSPVADPEPPDLSDYLYGPRPIPVDDAAQARALLRDTVQICTYADPSEEARAVAHQLKKVLQSGVPASRCMIAVPGLSGQMEFLRQVFADYGLPTALRASTPLAHTPLASVIRRVARVGAQDFPLTDSFALLRSTLVQLDLPDRASRLRQVEGWCLGAGIQGGLPLEWEPELVQWFARTRRDSEAPSDLQQTLAHLQAPLEPLGALSGSYPSTRDWVDALTQALVALGVVDRARGRALDAWASWVQCLDEWVADQQIEGALPVEGGQMLEALDRLLDRASLRPDPPRLDQVEVIDIDDILGLTPDYLWIVGLTQDRFPAADSDDFLVPRRFSQTLHTSRRAERGRYLFSSVLRNALDDKYMKRLFLSWPQVVGARPSPASTLLQDLLDLPTRALDPQGQVLTLGELIDLQPALDPQPLSPLSVQRAAAAVAEWATLLDERTQAVLAQQQIVHSARQAAEPGPHEGVFSETAGRTRTAGQRIAVTALEAFVKCPAKYWYQRILDLRTPDPATEDIAANRSGTALHTTFETFLNGRLGTALTGDPESLAAELHAHATAQLDVLVEQGGAAPALLQHLRTEWLAGLVDDQPHGILRVWLDHELSAAAHRKPVAVEADHTLPMGNSTLYARIDRVDETHSGVLVVDYKSGSAPSVSDVEEGVALQPIIYAAALEHSHKGGGELAVASTYQTLKSAAEVKLTGSVGDAAVLDDVGVSKRSRLPLTAAERQRYLRHATDAVRRLSAGVAHTTLIDPKTAGCHYCDFARICRSDPNRTADRLATDADLQRPMPPRGDA
ncbi:MAG: PD-(D/E)XK nuclease family protein [Myxococcota bacterium]